jgi:NAD(P)-dependent dehydrogenase (short-subunit alcohol dehydrogenase family)
MTNIVIGAASGMGRAIAGQMASRSRLLIADRDLDGVKALAADLGARPGLREQVIDRTRLRRTGTPEDIAYAAVYLASPAGSWITGTLLDINGGPVDELSPIVPDL